MDRKNLPAGYDSFEKIRKEESYDEDAIQRLEASVAAECMRLDFAEKMYLIPSSFKALHNPTA